MKTVADQFSWMADARCAGMPTDDFFPDRHTGRAAVAAAKEVCAGCPVKAQCLELALTADGEFQLPGVWGGTSENERRQIRRDRKRNRHQRNPEKVPA